MSATEMPLDGDNHGSALNDLGADPDERTDGLSGYAVKLAAFEGPLDLLLHLIRRCLKMTVVGVGGADYSAALS